MLYSSADLLDKREGPTARRKVVIVGAGTLGLYLGKLLVDKGHEVTNIESGAAELGVFPGESYASVGKPHRGLEHSRSRSLGGTSNLWGGQLVEFQSGDFQRRPWCPHSGWPIEYGEVRPYVERTYARLGFDITTLQDEEIWAERVGGRPKCGEDLEVFLTRWMKRPSMAVLYANDIRENPDWRILLSHTAVGFRGDGEKISAVVARDRAGRTYEVSGDCFVIAAGTVESVRLMLAAAADDAWECPWRANGMLGLRFQDHLGGRIGTVITENKRELFKIFSTLYWRGYKFQPKLRVSERAIMTKGLLGAQAMVVFESSATEHLVYLKQFVKAAIYSRQYSGAVELWRHAVACARHLPALMWAYVKEHRMYIPFDSTVAIVVQAEQCPCNSSRIALDPSWRDENGLARVLVDWRVDGCELDTICDLALRCKRELERTEIGTLEIDQDLLQKNPAFLDKLHDTYHAAGGAVMGEGEKDGVVDRDLRVFGTQNLHISSAAVLPTSGSANVTFMALVLATRLADHI